MCFWPGPGLVFSMLVGEITDVFDIIGAVGSGSYGEVFEGRERMTGEIVALKRVKLFSSDNGFPAAALAEIAALQRIGPHPNICRLKQVLTTKMRSVYLIFDYSGFDLYQIRRNISLTPLQVKCFMKQLLLGLAYVHEAGYMHRDLKPENILVSHSNELKIGDFGLARQWGGVQPRPMTSHVGTICYEAPELFLGAHEYGPSVDIWSCGCLLYYLIMKKDIFAGQREVQVIKAMLKRKGSPAREWPEFRSYPNTQVVSLFNTDTTANLETSLPKELPAEFRDAAPLILKMLKWNPKDRITAAEALEDPYFANTSESLEPSTLPQIYIHEDCEKKREKPAAIQRHIAPPSLGVLDLHVLPTPICT